MKTKVYCEHWDRVFLIDRHIGKYDVDVDNETYQRWQKVLAEFDEVQSEIEELYMKKVSLSNSYLD